MPDSERPTATGTKFSSTNCACTARLLRGITNCCSQTAAVNGLLIGSRENPCRSAISISQNPVMTATRLGVRALERIPSRDSDRLGRSKVSISHRQITDRLAIEHNHAIRGNIKMVDQALLKSGEHIGRSPNSYRWESRVSVIFQLLLYRWLADTKTRFSLALSVIILSVTR